MGRYEDIDPSDIDPDTDEPYFGYSSPSLDSFDLDPEYDDEVGTEVCSNCGSYFNGINNFRCPTCRSTS